MFVSVMLVRVTKNSLLCGNQPTNISPEIAWVLYIFLGNSLKKARNSGGKNESFPSYEIYLLSDKYLVHIIES